MTKITKESLQRPYGPNKEVTIGKEHLDQITEEWKNNIEMAIYPLQEEILDRVWSNKDNLKLDDKQHIKFLCKLVDRYYSTNLKEALYDTEHENTVITKICDNQGFFYKLKKQNKLENGDIIKIINLSKGLYSKTSTNNEKTVLSFMSKFSSRFNKDIVPIYDKLVREMLVKINNIPRWHFWKEKKQRLSVKALTGNYELYKQALDAFNDHYFENKLNYKELDKYLWTWAKLITNDTNDDNSDD